MILRWTVTANAVATGSSGGSWHSDDRNPRSWQSEVYTSCPKMMAS